MSLPLIARVAVSTNSWHRFLMNKMEKNEVWQRAKCIQQTFFQSNKKKLRKTCTEAEATKPRGMFLCQLVEI